jgi:8-oxo-dGTP diphosphatase
MNRPRGYLYYCSNCGGKYPQTKEFPRICPDCEQEKWSNPLPVVVVAVPVESGGYLVITRSIPPQIGCDALPGGFQETGESWQECGARELREETRIYVPHQHISLVDVITIRDGMIDIIFGQTPTIDIRPRDIDSFRPTDEVSAIRVVREPVELAFPTHTLILHRLLTRGALY